MVGGVSDLSISLTLAALLSHASVCLFHYHPPLSKSYNNPYPSSSSSTHHMKRNPCASDSTDETSQKTYLLHEDLNIAKVGNQACKLKTREPEQLSFIQALVSKVTVDRYLTTEHRYVNHEAPNHSSSLKMKREKKIRDAIFCIYHYNVPISSTQETTGGGSHHEPHLKSK